MEAIVPFLFLVNVTATVATLFAAFRQREGYGVALASIGLGWVCFLLPWYFFGPWGAVIGLVFTMVVGGIVNSARPPHERKRVRSSNDG